MKARIDWGLTMHQRLAIDAYDVVMKTTAQTIGAPREDLRRLQISEQATGVASARDESMIEFIIRPTAESWEICRDGINIGRFVTRRQALKTLAAMRAELRANGQRSLVKFEPRLRHHPANRRNR